jgi:hypothetical protein
MKKDLFDLGVPFAAGGVVFLLAAFASGAVTATNTSQLNVAKARIDERATICQEAAMTVLAEATQPTDFSGVEGKKRRDALAMDFVIPSGDDRTDRLVLDECSKRLDT